MSPGETADWYRRFGELEARGNSPIFEQWALGVATDDDILALLETLPLQKRQPNLVFACARLLGAPVGDYAALRSWLLANWTAVADEAQKRSTQTNEPRRCATLLPALALLPGPLALLEVGASAGLCLYPDRYSYRYDGGDILDPAAGRSSVLLESATTDNAPVPTALPDIVWRAGIDTNPLDVRNDDDMLWLETLLWPEQHERRQRLQAAVEIARADPPRLVRGDAIDALAGLVAEAPDEATLVIVASAVLVYLVAADRARFVDTVAATGADWISLEGYGALPAVAAAMPGELPEGNGKGRFVLALNQKPLAWTGPHGQFLDWIA
jgi:hypothetical protein